MGGINAHKESAMQRIIIGGRPSKGTPADKRLSENKGKGTAVPPVKKK